MRKCPVCGMALDAPGAVPVTLRRGDDVWEFCSEACKERFAVDPQKFEVPEEDEE